MVKRSPSGTPNQTKNRKYMYHKNALIVFATLVTAALALQWPLLLLALIAANLALQLVVMGMQLFFSRFPAENPVRIDHLDTEPFVSIHVPTHNEPPEVVEQTLRSLSKLRWRNYEVLVIDNNTSNPALWEPLRDLCRELGPKFRFFHVENLPGFKAGAMNYVRQFMAPRAQFIFVVDADYVVERSALKVALSYFTDPQIGLIQFPQNYRHVTRANQGIALDYKHFFTGFMNVANRLGCVPSTGTLSLVNVRALESIGGFNPAAITEDADLGLKLSLHGFRSIYANKVIGSGLMPHELEGLKKQRWRWTFGNAQILRRNWPQLLYSPSLTLKQRLGFITHLTAWFSFNLIPSLALILLAFFSTVGALDAAQIYTVTLAGFSLLTYVALKYGIIHYSLQADHHRFPDIAKAFASNMGLGWVLSASWLRCLFLSDAPFIRTNKFLSDVMPRAIKNMMIELTLGVALLASALIFYLSGFVFGPIAAFLMFGARFAICWVYFQTRSTFEATTALFPKSESTPQVVA